MTEVPTRIDKTPLSHRHLRTDLNSWGRSREDMYAPEGTLGWHIERFVSEAPEKLVVGLASLIAKGVRKLASVNPRLRKS